MGEMLSCMFCGIMIGRKLIIKKHYVLILTGGKLLNAIFVALWPLQITNWKSTHHCTLQNLLKANSSRLECFDWTRFRKVHCYIQRPFHVYFVASWLVGSQTCRITLSWAKVPLTSCLVASCQSEGIYFTPRHRRIDFFLHILWHHI